MSSPHGAGGMSPTAMATRFAPSGHRHRDDDDDDDDHYGADVLPPHLAALDDDDLNTQGGKKRKVPVPLIPGSVDDADTGRDGADRNPPRSAREDTDTPGISPYSVCRVVGTPASRLAAQRRALFHKRKAGLVALYLDAQGAVDSSAAHLAALRSRSTGGAPGAAPTIASGTSTSTSSSSRPSLPDVSTFERLLPALEDVGVWAPDAPGWREGDDAAHPVPRRSLERWRTGFATRKRVRMERVPVVRGGWAPEGSFELEVPTEASVRARARARERVALARLAEQLRALVLAANKLPTAPDASPAGTPPPTLSAADLPPAPPVPVATKKNKKKKKKRTTLANEGNPHHVDKYRPSRPVPVANPYEPWPHHASLLFPPPMRILAARPGGKDVRAGEDEYICFSCQYALSYGSEALRKHAIKQRKAELKRLEKLRARAFGNTHGNRPRARPHSHSGDGSGSEDDDEEYDDDDNDECGDDDDGAGRCTCGRALRKPHIEDEAEPPDKPP